MTRSRRRIATRVGPTFGTGTADRIPPSPSQMPRNACRQLQTREETPPGAEADRPDGRVSAADSTGISYQDSEPDSSTPKTGSPTIDDLTGRLARSVSGWVR